MLGSAREAFNPFRLVADHGSVVDEFAHVSDATASRWALAVRASLGVRVGLTTGATVAAAADLARHAGVHVVAVAADACDVFLPQMGRLAVRDERGPGVHWGGALRGEAPRG